MPEPQHPHLAPFRLLPTAPGTCPECAVEHAPEEPHNQQSLTYRYSFFGKHGRWPKWRDAIAHCTPAVQAVWIEELKKKGIDVDA